MPGKGRIDGERRRQCQEKCQRRGEVQGREKYRARRNATEGKKWLGGENRESGEVSMKGRSAGEKK